MPAGRIRTIPEVYDWEQVRDTMVLNVPHPTLGDLEMPGSPLQLSESGEARTEAPPSLGADQQSVFAEYACGSGR